MLKPRHEGGYTASHAEMCERTLVTLLRGLGPWKHGVYLAGGLVPRYLIHPREGIRAPHAGTTDVDLVLSLQVLAGTGAYRKLEANLKAMGFERGTNEDGQAQHHSWWKRIQTRAEATGEAESGTSGAGGEEAPGEHVVVVDLLCDPLEMREQEGTRVVPLPGERRLSALRIPGAHLIERDHVQCEITAEALDGGLATEVVRVASVVPFIVLKALAYEDRSEEKDAYDLLYVLMYFGEGPKEVAGVFAQRLREWADEPLLLRALSILRLRFGTDEHGPSHRKEGPTKYARFRARPDRPERDARNRLDAAATVDLFLSEVDRLLADHTRGT